MALNKTRVSRLLDAGAFRDQLPGATDKFKRGTQRTYGDVEGVQGIQGSTITSTSGKTVDIKRVLAVLGGSSIPAHGDHQAQPFGFNEANAERKRVILAPIIARLEYVIPGAGQCITVSAAVVRLKAVVPNYNELLKETKVNLPGILKLLPGKFKVVEGVKIERL